MSLLSFEAKDQPDLYQAFEQWHSSYWQIIRMQREGRLPICPPRVEALAPKNKGCAPAIVEHA